MSTHSNEEYQPEPLIEGGQAEEEVKSQQGPKRPFLEYWEALEKLELQRRKGYIADCRYVMTLAFIDYITPEKFLE